MKLDTFENSDGGRAKSGEVVPAAVERNSLREMRLKPKTWKRGVQLRGTVRPAGRVAVALASVWMLVALWAYPAQGWWRTISGVGGSGDEAQALIRDAAGDVIAAGQISANFAVTKLSGATGVELWREVIDGTYSRYPEDDKDEAHAVAVDGSGDVIAAGYLQNSITDYDFTVIKFSGATGEFGGTRTGKSLLVKDNASGPDRRQLKVLSKDPNWPVPAQGSANDPTLAGASVRLVNPYSAEQATFDLPPGPLWRVTSSVSGAVKYVYRDPTGINGPCNTVQATSGKRVRAVCNGRTGLIPFTVDEPSQGTLVVSVQFGDAEPQCAWFGGRIMKDQGTSNPGPTGIFKAKDAMSRAATCPAPPSPSAAFLDVTTGVLD